MSEEPPPPPPPAPAPPAVTDRRAPAPPLAPPQRARAARARRRRLLAPDTRTGRAPPRLGARAGLPAAGRGGARTRLRPPPRAAPLLRRALRTLRALRALRAGPLWAPLRPLAARGGSRAAERPEGACRGREPLGATFGKSKCCLPTRHAFRINRSFQPLDFPPGMLPLLCKQ